MYDGVSIKFPLFYAVFVVYVLLRLAARRMSVCIPFDSSLEHYTLYSSSMQELFVEPPVFCLLSFRRQKCAFETENNYEFSVIYNNISSVRLDKLYVNMIK